MGLNRSTPKNSQTSPGEQTREHYCSRIGSNLTGGGLLTVSPALGASEGLLKYRSKSMKEREGKKGLMILRNKRW